MRNLTFNLRILSYQLKSLFKSNKKQSDVHSKLIKLYARKGRYDKAISHAESIYYKESHHDIGFVLANLYDLNGKLDKSEEILKSNIPLGDNLIAGINSLNDSINHDQLLQFIFNYLNNKKVNVSFINVINKGKRLKNKSKSEKNLINNQDMYVKDRPSWSQGLIAPEYIQNLYCEGNDYISKVYETSVPVLRSTKVVLKELDNGVSSVENGCRTTVSQPDDAKSRLLVFGSSTTYGIGCSDTDTIPSIIQSILNNKNANVKVENHGVLGMNLLLAFNNLLQTEINPGDTVVFFDFDEFRDTSWAGIKNIDLNKIDRKDDFFIDLTKHQCHFSPRGNKVISNVICNDFLLDNIDNSVPANEDVYLDEKVISVLDNFKYFLYKQTAKTFENCEMKSYLSLLESHVPDAELKVGSVAVNCNPITKGHLHLLEHASRSVDKLFIFVIEEDKSFFKFEDRLHLVAESTKHLENVTVLRGGKFICTELTYPDYFDKDTTEAKADASMEAWFFCEYIAKTLNITKIFLGDEPKCMITKQYNEKMQELLPEYGIEVDIIDRIATNGDVISASKVRKLLEIGDFDGIAQIVPEPTLLFLQDNYGKSAA
ncbi:citrate lyase ligase [Vibrio sp. D420a]|uniref:citrate lyase ligase n=1 Tax=Vibrio sp. D420a TaxID=2836895 RepID=UPI0025560DA4|nr:citrate lyase ligase [Vibrio sp. D420a]MDK9760878.1 citrate lyase ligase [Vibrio sp. D420a]